MISLIEFVHLVAKSEREVQQWASERVEEVDGWKKSICIFNYQFLKYLFEDPNTTLHPSPWSSSASITWATGIMNKKCIFMRPPPWADTLLILLCPDLHPENVYERRPADDVNAPRNALCMCLSTRDSKYRWSPRLFSDRYELSNINSSCAAIPVKMPRKLRLWSTKKRISPWRRMPNRRWWLLFQPCPYYNTSVRYS